MEGTRGGAPELEAFEAPSWLLSYYLWDATLGELHRRRGDRERALAHTERALAAAPTNPEKALLERRLKEISCHHGSDQGSAGSWSVTPIETSQKS